MKYTDALRNDHAVEKAAALNATVELPAPDELQIDLDEDFGHRFEMQYHLLVDLDLIPKSSGYLVRFSKSGNKHISIRLGEDISPERRILLQALLGSDLKREALSLKRVDIGEPNPTMFFRPKV